MRFFKQFQQETLKVEVNGEDLKQGERFLVPVVRVAPTYARNLHIVPARIDYLQTIP
jgi:hypothetical protein